MVNVFTLFQPMFYLIVAMVVHEIGHGIVLLLFNRRLPRFNFDPIKLKIEAGTEKDYVLLNPVKKVIVYCAGIVSGYIALHLLLRPFDFLDVIMLLLYAILCIPDTKLIAKQLRLHFIPN